ncbi:RNA-binding domain-containing protein [Piromyces finnis]|uniref:RNA-binding domain-containing protein n=1 Tax=Piromyces finnis TaxID=1754191 RepID=A0A1Y1V7B0_9FUNG|nr:RNA-binding domain-containing protein [Piromyces finnis]|eukprot:ORX48910.1 RNA-binding domain-containing protein [Piromyces finnis]
MSGSRIYIGRLSSRAEKRDVEKFFKEYGDIREINLKNGFGFVEFKDYRDAEDAVKESNDREFFGHRIIVEIAKGERRRGRYNDRRGGDYDRRNNNAPQRTDNRIYVENIAQSVSWQDLKDFFRRAGQVTFADAHKRREGEGIVEFSSYDDVKEALHKLDGYELKGQKITLRDVCLNNLSNYY